MSRLYQIPGEIATCEAEIQALQEEIAKLRCDLEELFELDGKFTRVNADLDAYQSKELTRVDKLQGHSNSVGFARKHAQVMTDYLSGSRCEGVFSNIDSTKTRIAAKADETETEIEEKERRIGYLQGRIDDLGREKTHLKAEKAKKEAEEAAKAAGQK